MTKITPQPTHTDCKPALDWLAESEINTAWDYQCTALIRLLIAKVNELSTEVDYLRNRTNQHDSFL